MPQGLRRGWVRAAFGGLGAVLCAGAIGCTGADKDKDTRIGTNPTGKQPGVGLPGTPTLLPGSPPGPAGTTKTGTNGLSNTFGTPSNPAGGAWGGTSGVPTGAGAGSTVSPAGGTFGRPGTGNPAVPSAGPGGYQSGAGFGGTPQPNQHILTGAQPVHTAGGGHAAYTPPPPPLNVADIQPPLPPGGAGGPILPPGRPPVSPAGGFGDVGGK